MNPVRNAWKRALAWVALVPFALTTLVVPLPVGGLAGVSSGVAYAQSGTKDQLAILPLARRDGVGTLATARIEEYLRAMIEAGNVVQLVPTEVVNSGRPRFRRSGRVTQRSTAATQNLAKADQALLAARTMLDEGKNTDVALKLLRAALKRYERHFVELVDFTKMVDAYGRAARAALKKGKKGTAAAFLTKAVALQPTFVTNRGEGEMAKLLTIVRGRLEKRSKGTISVTCKTPGAEVYVDGVKLGSAPAVSKDLYAGTHYVQVRHKNAEPWGKAFTVRGRKIDVEAKLEMLEDPKDNIALAVKPSDIKPFAGKGNYHTKLVRNFTFMFSRQIQARFMLFGVVARASRGISLHMFLFDQKVKKFVALDPVPFSTNLSNMQMKILEAEGHIRRAVQTFPMAKEVTAQPTVYTKTRAATAAPAIVTPPTTVPPVTTTPPTTTTPSTGTPSGTTEPPRVTSPVVRTTTPSTTQPPKTAEDPYKNLLKGKDDRDETIVKKWWFWTAIGVLAAGGIATAVILSNQTPNPSANFKVDVLVQP